MAAPEFLTWDGDTASGTLPYRPGTEDVGRDDLVNDTKEPPDEETMPGAGGWNQRAKQIAAMGAMARTARFVVTFSGGAPSIQQQQHLRTTEPSGLSIVDNGVGDTSITWDADQFPTPGAQPEATLNTAVGMIRAYNITNGVRIVTLDSAGAAADIGFTVTYG